MMGSLKRLVLTVLVALVAGGVLMWAIDEYGLLAVLLAIPSAVAAGLSFILGSRPGGRQGDTSRPRRGSLGGAPEPVPTTAPEQMGAPNQPTEAPKRPRRGGF